MKSYVMGSLAILLLLVPSAAVSFAQASMSAAQEAQQLRNDLGQLQDREAEIKIRLVELDEELRPENIERYFAGVGSTRPEELREMRRKKLQIEKDRLEAQLGTIGQDRARLESAIQTAESRAYYESAMNSSAAPIQRRMSPLAALLAGTNRKVAAVAISLILIGAIVALVRHRRSRASG
jgi:chromosome segregation ATPase